MRAALSLAALAAPPGARASDKGALDGIFGSWIVGQATLGSRTLIQNYDIQESVEFVGTSQPRTDVHIVRTRAGHFRFELTRPGAGTVVQAYDGRLGWQAQPQWGLGLAANLPSDAWAWQNNLLAAVSAFRPPFDYRALPEAQVGGRPCIVAAVTDAGKLEGKCFFDRRNRRLLRIERQAAPGSAQTLAIEFDDFRKLDGLWIPFVTKVTAGSSVTLHRRSKVVLNPPVDESSFVLPTAQLQEALAVGAVLSKHERTIGGVEAIVRIHTRVTHLVVDISTTGTKTSETISQKSPNLILIETETPGMGREARGFDGTTGWMSSELQGYRPLKPAELAQLVGEGGIHLVGRLNETYPFRRLLGERVINGRPAIAVALASQQGPAGTFYFDKENGRLLRVSSPVAGDRNTSTESATDFSDFRKVDGLEIPFELVQISPMARVTSTVKSVENNVPLDDAIFRPRRDE
jgi:hypothetical protein